MEHRKSRHKAGNDEMNAFPSSWDAHIQMTQKHYMSYMPQRRFHQIEQ